MLPSLLLININNMEEERLMEEESLFDLSCNNSMFSRLDNFRDPNTDQLINDKGPSNFSISLDNYLDFKIKKYKKFYTIARGSISNIVITPSPSINNIPNYVIEWNNHDSIKITDSGSIFANDISDESIYIKITDIKNNLSEEFFINVIDYKLVSIVNESPDYLTIDKTETYLGGYFLIDVVDDSTEFGTYSIMINEDSIDNPIMPFETTANSYINYVSIKVNTPLIDVTDQGGSNYLITITCSTPEATIKYRTTTSEDWTTYSNAFTIHLKAGGSMNLFVKAVKSEYTDSDTASVTIGS